MVALIGYALLFPGDARRLNGLPNHNLKTYWDSDRPVVFRNGLPAATQGP